MKNRNVLLSVILVMLFLDLLVGCDLIYPFLFPAVDLTVANDTGDTLTAFYAKRASSEAWGGSRLKAELADGASAVLSLDKDIYDFRAVFASGEPLEQQDIDLGDYELYTLTLNPAGTP